MLLEIPQGCCENVINQKERDGFNPNCFKVLKSLVKEIPPMNKLISVLFNGSGFSYNGEIYHISKDYVYFYLY